MKIGVLGSGVVGQVLADGLLQHGHDVMRGSREPAKLASWRAHHGAHAQVGTFEEAARFGSLVVLAVKGVAAVEVVIACGDALDGKAVLDATNPIAESPPEDGVLKFFTGPNESLLERLQAAAPKAHLVKAFSCVGNALMVNPSLPGGPPTMFICGNDESARRQATELASQLGWAVEDMGRATAARAIEPLCMLWCIPGLRQNRWQHAFRLLSR
jgi:predicted dinucleotide-binding enzyme